MQWAFTFAAYSKFTTDLPSLDASPIQTSTAAAGTPGNTIFNADLLQVGSVVQAQGLVNAGFDRGGLRRIASCGQAPSLPGLHVESFLGPQHFSAETAPAMHDGLAQRVTHDVLSRHGTAVFPVLTFQAPLTCVLCCVRREAGTLDQARSLPRTSTTCTLATTALASPSTTSARAEDTAAVAKTGCQTAGPRSSWHQSGRVRGATQHRSQGSTVMPAARCRGLEPAPSPRHGQRAAGRAGTS